MPVLLKEPEELLPIAGVRLASVDAGIYKHDRDDIVLIEIAEASNCAAVFTKNAFSAAPVIVAREHLRGFSPLFCLVNAGNANAGTGQRGIADAKASCAFLAANTGCKPEQVLPFSTGVIGEYLPMDKIKVAVAELISSLDELNWLACANAITTTDTVAKGVSRKVQLGNETIKITGIAKGSGMIRPDMATMLAFIATDAHVDVQLLDQLLKNSMGISFNRISVDGDTSTNDACLLIATGKSGVEIGKDSGSYLEILQVAVNEICIELAQAIVRDGEGATKFISVEVVGGESSGQCLEIAYNVANSPLVKTAMFACDPNWGRIIAAVGRSRSGILEPEKISIFLNELCIVHHGEKAQGYSEKAGQTEMSKDEIAIRIDLGIGTATETVWTSDLSHEYVRINAEYRS